jgi:uncharacterized protein YbbK (DUF523 family)
MVKVLVSACLLGERVRYNGADARCASDVLDRWAREGRLELEEADAFVRALDQL